MSQLFIVQIMISISIRNKKPLLLVWILIGLMIVTSACVSADSQVHPTTTIPLSTPTLTRTITPIESPQSTDIVSLSPTPSATPTSLNTPQIVLTHNLIVSNPNPWDSQLFIDNIYAITIPSNQTVVYYDLIEGEHTLYYCHLKDFIECDPPQIYLINKHLKLAIIDSSSQEVVPTSGNISIPTPPIIHSNDHVIKVNNRTPWTIYVYIKGRLVLQPANTPSVLDKQKPEDRSFNFVPLMEISGNSYLTFSGLTTDTYTFIHCYDKSMKACFLHKKIVLDRDTEWYVYP